MITIDSTKCNGCGLCVRDCYPAYLGLDSHGHATITGERCLQCGHCGAICPQEAICMTDYDPTQAEALTTVDAPSLQSFMKSRRSIRQYQNKPVPHKLLSEIIQTGRYTPTGSNSQSVSYIVLDQQLPSIREMAAQTLNRLADDPAKKMYAASLKRIYDDHLAGKDSLFHGAPVVILIVDHQPTGINGALAASRMELMANALGLGACFVGFFVQAIDANSDLRTTLQLSPDDRAITSLTIGYPAITYARTALRKPAKVTWL